MIRRIVYKKCLVNVEIYIMGNENAYGCKDTRTPNSDPTQRAETTKSDLIESKRPLTTFENIMSEPREHVRDA